MEKRYLIRMNEPADWLRHWDEGTQVVNDFIFPYGPCEKHEMSDTIYHKDAAVGCHQHMKGFETLVAGPDCLVHIPPFHKHSIKVLEDTQLYDYGGETDLMAMLEDLKSLEVYKSDKLKDPEFMRKFYRKYRCFVTDCYKEA